MFAVEVGESRFEYDVQALVKAFYPQENVRVITPDIGREKREEAEKSLRLKIELHQKGASLFFLKPAPTDEVKRNGEQAVDKSYVWNAEAEAEGTESKAYKTEFKRFFYHALVDYTQKTLPWGSLTGIRPTKIAMGLLEEGASGEEVISFLQDTYFVSSRKAALSVEIAQREKELLSRIHPEDGYSLYIGIPFCPTTCLYCSFTSYPLCKFERMVEAYIDCLIKELQFVGEAYKNRVLDSVYIGGGTPTTLSPRQLQRLLDKIEGCFDFSHLLEYTVEAGRPDSITRDKLNVLREHNISRISINPQTMKQATLDLIGRRHTVEEICETFYMARELGFDNINMDIILGLAKETPQDVEETLSRIGELSPDNLTVHTLAVKRAARLNTNRDEYAGLEACGVQEMLRVSREFARENNYHPYYLYRQKNMAENLENIGYARRGKEGLYNILIMEERQTILALGAGATSKFILPGGGRMVRVENVKSLRDYIGRIDEMIARKENFLCEYGDEL